MKTKSARIKALGAASADGRYSVDGSGEIHRFSIDRNGVWHWSGSTGDSAAPLSGGVIPNWIRQLTSVDHHISRGKR